MSSPRVPLPPSRRRALQRLAVVSYSLVPATGETRLSVRRPGRKPHVSCHATRDEAVAVAFGLGCEAVSR